MCWLLLSFFSILGARRGVVRPGTKFVRSTWNFLAYINYVFEDCLRAWSLKYWCEVDSAAPNVHVACLMFVESDGQCLFLITGIPRDVCMDCYEFVINDCQILSLIVGRFHTSWECSHTLPWVWERLQPTPFFDNWWFLCIQGVFA